MTSTSATVDSIHGAERLAFPVLIIVLLLVFRSPVAAAIPLIIALATTQAGFGVISIITEFADLDAIALSLASMIGLALGVDYSLLIVTRFREALEATAATPDRRPRWPQTPPGGRRSSPASC